MKLKKKKTKTKIKEANDKELKERKKILEHNMEIQEKKEHTDKVKRRQA